jgi:hypothetical protein
MFAAISSSFSLVFMPGSSMTVSSSSFRMMPCKGAAWWCQKACGFWQKAINLPLCHSNKID